MRLFFPHISRFFSATLWGALVALFAVNIFAQVNYAPTHKNALLAIFTNPGRWAPHVDLAQTLWSEGTKDQAKHELAIARDLFVGDPRVLGDTTTPDALLTAWEQEPVQRQTKMQRWQQVVTEHTDYRDGYIELARLAYNLGNKAQASSYILRAHILDPNNVTVNRLLEFLK